MSSEAPVPGGWQPSRRWSLGAAVVVALLVLPFVPLLITSLGHAYFFPQLLPETWSARAWSRVLAADAATWPALRMSVAVALAVTAVSMAVAVPAGRVLATRRFPGRAGVELLLFAPTLVPAVAIGIGLHAVFVRLGLDGGVSGVVLAQLVPAAPYVILLVASVFANADLELEQQARSLGASWWRVQWHVTLPLVAPGLTVAALFGFLVSWGQYTLTLVIGGGRVVTLPILLFSVASGGDSSVTAATALFHATPAALALLLSAVVLGGRHAELGGAR
ncbi:MAG: ABC transporter permease subunit [Nitriliruptoraceae bacterium]